MRAWKPDGQVSRFDSIRRRQPCLLYAFDLIDWLIERRDRHGAQRVIAASCFLAASPQGVMGRKAQGEQMWSAVPMIATVKEGALGWKPWARFGPRRQCINYRYSAAVTGMGGSSARRD